MRLQGSLFLLFFLLIRIGYAQNKENEFIRSVLQKTARLDVFSYKFTVYFKSIGDVEMPKPWEGVAYIRPEKFVCKYTSWGGRHCDFYSLRIGDSALRYFIYPEKKQFKWSISDKENFAPHSGFNCYSALAEVDKPLYYTKEASFSFLKDSFLNGMNCTVLTSFENKKGLTNWSESRFYINKADSFLVGFESFVAFGGIDTIYKGFFFSDIRVNERFDDKELKSKLATFKDITFDTILNPPFVPAKAKGDQIPSFEASGLFNNSKQVSYTKGKVVLLDFWYMACYGCILSYPIMNRLHEEYAGNKLVEIYSVNAFDLEKKQLPKLRDYVKKYDMKSNLLKMNHEEFASFKTNAYPTFYVIVNGIVKAIKIGSHDDLYMELKTLIDDGLNQLK